MKSQPPSPVTPSALYNEVGKDAAPPPPRESLDYPHTYHAFQPPSTLSTWPVTKLLASLARKITAPASSYGCPHRPIGVRSQMKRWRSGSLKTVCVSGVSQ